MFDLMQYALIFYDFQLILAQMPRRGAGSMVKQSSTNQYFRPTPDARRGLHRRVMPL